MPTTAPATLNDIREEVLFLTQPFPHATLTSGNTPPALGSFRDPGRLVDPHLGGVYVGAWLLRTGADIGSYDRERRVTAHDTANGTLTVVPDFIDLPDVSETYEVWTLDKPTYAERLINAALGRVRAPLDSPIATLAGQRQYSLSALTWLVRPSQVLGVVARSGPALATVDTPVEGWRIYQSGSALTLDLRESTWQDGDTLILRAFKDFEGPINWTAGSQTHAPLELVAAEAAYDLMRRPPQGIDSSPDLLNQRKERKNDLKRSLLAIRDKYRSGIPVPLFAESETWGIGTASHTPGDRWR
jgi:hypothetical protein